jgi:NitT/TauT family transport system substrate-binding protein
MALTFRGSIVGAAVLAGAMVAAFFWWMQADVPKNGHQTSGIPIRASYECWPGMYWMDIAQAKGWFAEAGLTVQMDFDANKDFIGSMKAVVEGNLDVCQFVFYDMIKYLVNGADLVGVVDTDRSLGGDGIVANASIKTVRELRGKRIGLERGSFTEYILFEALKREKLTLADVTLVETTVEDIEAFTKGTIDALVCWEPVLTQAMEDGNGRIIFTTAEVPGLIQNVMVFPRPFLESRPQDVQAFVNVWHRTVQHIKNDPKDAFGIIAKKYGKTPGEVQAFAQQDKILDLQDNLRVFSYSAGFESLHGSARKMNDFMIGHGLTKQRLDSTEFLDARFIRGLERQGS